MTVASYFMADILGAKATLGTLYNCYLYIGGICLAGLFFSVGLILYDIAYRKKTDDNVLLLEETESETKSQNKSKTVAEIRPEIKASDKNVMLYKKAEDAKIYRQIRRSVMDMPRKNNNIAKNFGF